MSSTVRRPRGEYRKTRGRRKEIVEAAVEVFATAGFNKGSLRDVADRAGLSQAGLLHHFPNKESLAQAVLTWRDEDARAHMGTPLPVGADLLRRLIDLVAYNARNPALMELHVVLSGEAASAEHPLHGYLVDRYAEVFGVVHTAIVQADLSGELRPGVEADSATRTLIALMDGLQLQWLLTRGGVDMAADVQRYLASLLTVPL
jgi:AcrR family transcriptional regulator